MDQRNLSKIKESIIGPDSKIIQQKDDYVTNTITLLKKCAEVNATEKILATERMKFKTNMTLLQKRNEEFIKKEKLLEESTKKYEKYFQKNELKLTQANKKIEEETVNENKLSNDITSLSNEIQFLQQKEIKLNQQIQNYQVYQEFVRRVVDSSGGEFNTVNDVINRFEILKTILKELSDQEKLLNEEIAKERIQMMQYIEEKSNEMLKINNDIAELQRNVDHAVNEALKWESKWNHLKKTMMTKSREKSRIKMTVRNLFNIIIKHQNLDFYTEDTMQQLEKIQEFIVDWKEVVEELKSTNMTSEAPLYSSDSYKYIN